MFVNGYKVVVFHAGKEITMCKTTDYRIAEDVYSRLEKVVGAIEEYEERSDYTVLYSNAKIEPTTLYIPVEEES